MSSIWNDILNERRKQKDNYYITNDYIQKIFKKLNTFALVNNQGIAYWFAHRFKIDTYDFEYKTAILFEEDILKYQMLCSKIIYRNLKHMRKLHLLESDNIGRSKMD